MKHKFTNVMLIDDSDLDNFINKKIIEHSQFAKNVFVHSNAKNALAFFDNLINLGDGQQELYPEIIFVDINMTVMNGFQFIEELLKNFERLLVKPKLFILTSSQFREDRQRATDLSPDIGFLSKPLTAHILESLL